MNENKLKEIALSYIGTPHINGGNVKGAGLDCCTLPASIYRELMGLETDITFGYSGDWYLKRGCKEILLPYLEKYCDRVDSLQTGDTISFSFGRARYAHLAVYLGNNTVIHCSADFGTEVTDLKNPLFFDSNGASRISGYWRVKTK